MDCWAWKKSQLKCEEEIFDPRRQISLIQLQFLPQSFDKKKKKNSRCPCLKGQHFLKECWGKQENIACIQAEHFTLSITSAVVPHLQRLPATIIWEVTVDLFYSVLCGGRSLHQQCGTSPKQIFLLAQICFSLEQYAEALIMIVHHECFLGRLFLTSAAAAGLENICIEAIKQNKKIM